ncbi:Txe/YoeB family addiction module toxin [Microbacterium sp. NPDC055683]
MIRRGGTPITSKRGSAVLKTHRRIDQLIADMLRDDPFEGFGKPEALKHALAGAWSHRIDEANRLVYIASDTHLTILQARYHC